MINKSRRSYDMTKLRRQFSQKTGALIFEASFPCSTWVFIKKWYILKPFWPARNPQRLAMPLVIFPPRDRIISMWWGKCTVYIFALQHVSLDVRKFGEHWAWFKRQKWSNWFWGGEVDRWPLMSLEVIFSQVVSFESSRNSTINGQNLTHVLYLDATSRPWTQLTCSNPLKKDDHKLVM